VHVLRFVGVESVANHVHELERDHEGKQAGGGHEFGAGYLEIICTAFDP
jgi:hypothetical protein